MEFWRRVLRQVRKQSPTRSQRVIGRSMSHSSNSPTTLYTGAARAIPACRSARHVFNWNSPDAYPDSCTRRIRATTYAPILARSRYTRGRSLPRGCLRPPGCSPVRPRRSLAASRCRDLLTATDVIAGPIVSSELSCGLSGQAYLSDTAFRPTGREYVKVQCARTSSIAKQRGFPPPPWKAH
jgi:hypothetical protein